jgi:hypothetical protein
MKTIVAVLALALVAAGAAGAATKPKPKPWSWTPTKTATRLVAANPNLGTSDPGEITRATCRGVGKAIAGRFVSFRCAVEWTPLGLSGGYDYVVFVKIRPTGTGKMCVARDSFASIPAACLTV